MKITRHIFIIMISVTMLFLSACDRSRDNGTTTNYTVTLPSHNSSVYTSFTNGPRYAAVQLTNTMSSGNLTVTTTPTIDTSNGPGTVVIASNTNVYGSLTPCVTSTSLTPGQSCYVFVYTDPTTANLFTHIGAFDQTLSISTSVGNTSVSIESQGFLYIGGDFNQLGDASYGSIDVNYLLAKCAFTTSTNQLSCTNALTGNTNPYANANIYTLTTDNAGNIYAGGAFTQLANQSVTQGMLLAQYNPSTTVVSNSFNNINNPDNTATGSPSITAIKFDSSNYAYVTGSIAQAGGISTATPTAGRTLIARCDLLTNHNCVSNVLSASAPNTDYVQGNPIYTFSFYNSDAYLLFGGNMSRTGTVAPTPANTTNSGSCPLTSGIATQACTQLLSAGTLPSTYVFTTTLTSNTLYMGGRFTSIGSFTGPSSKSGAFLAQCTISGGQVTCDNNALGPTADNIYVSGGYTDDSNQGEIRATALDNAGNIFMVGTFDTLTDATTSTTLAQSTPSQLNPPANGGPDLVVRCVANSPTTASCTDLLSGTTLDGANNTINALTPNVEITSATVN